ncbi:MAG: hypothetical protein ACOX52_10005 [Verrucomicrobiota bacterium]
MEMNTVALVHYHLRPGGVTSVLRACVTALRSAGVRTVVLTGEPVGEGEERWGPVECVPELAYGEAYSDHGVRRLSAVLYAAARNVLGTPPDLWHFHNPSLGKNELLWPVLQHWAERGRRMLLQIHDFPEDGRPENYRLLRTVSAEHSPECMGSVLYPVGGGVHYAVLTKRACKRLVDAGIPEERVHHLPNCTQLTGDTRVEPESPRERRTLLYPVRGIMRKNLGEFLLWSVLGGREGIRFAVSLAPIRPEERRVFEWWRDLTEGWGLPVAFETGISALRTASGVMTTSVKEGFGLAFVEGAAAGLPVLGRDLPEVTSDLRGEGMQLSGLYKRLRVPLRWIELDMFRQELSVQMARMWRDYGRAFHSELVETALSEWIEDDRIDFGCLTREWQRRVIQRVIIRKDDAEEITPRILGWDWTVAGESIERDRQVVRERYSMDAYRARLSAVLDRIESTPEDGIEWLEGDALVDGFLDPTGFRPVLA